MALNISSLRKNIFSINSDSEFNEAAIQVFNFQYNYNKTYQLYVDLLRIDPLSITKTTEIPFLPIQFFKTHKIITDCIEPQVVFKSSGTTGLLTSNHFVTDISIYEESFTKSFEKFYGNPDDLCILALLPSYLERNDSSLVFMVDKLIGRSKNQDSGFYLYNTDDLVIKLKQLKRNNIQTLLIGVSYALLFLAEQHRIDLSGLTIMETGGMKGKRKELIREELHRILCESFNVKGIHSEYGMTELLSQAYSKGDGVFYCPAWMKIFIRDTSDPMSILENNKSGGINVIDLANLHSCSFIATQDLGKTYDSEAFEVLGRFDNSDIRGCNLLV